MRGKETFALMVSVIFCASCDSKLSDSEINASCMRQIDALRTLEVCSSIYSTAEVYNESGSPSSCIDETAQKIATSRTRTLAFSAEYYPWQHGCSSRLTGRAAIITPDDVFDIVRNKCDDRAAVRQFTECVRHWSP